MMWGVSEDMVRMGGVDPYLKKHLLTGEDDWTVVKYLMEHTEFVSLYDEFAATVEKIGPNGFVGANICRVPFQQMMLEFLGEIPLFYAIYDPPKIIKDLFDLIDEDLTENLHQLATFGGLYIEFPDNLDGMMPNPDLF